MKLRDIVCMGLQTDRAERIAALGRAEGGR